MVLQRPGCHNLRCLGYPLCVHERGRQCMSRLQDPTYKLEPRG